MNISNITNQIVLQLINVITLMTNTFRLKAFIQKMIIVRWLFIPEYLQETFMYSPVGYTDFVSIKNK